MREYVSHSCATAQSTHLQQVTHSHNAGATLIINMHMESD